MSRRNPPARPRRRAPAGLLVKLLAIPLLTAVAAGSSTPARAQSAAPSEGAAAVTAAHPTAGAAAAVAERRFAEVRALWVIRTALGSAEQVRAMVEQAAAGGFNTLLVQVRGRGDALYASAREPRAESLPDDPAYDPLQVTIAAARARGLAVHAWVNTHLVWGPVAPPRSPDHLVNAHPDWLAVPRSLGRELYDHDPQDPGYVERLLAHAAESTLLEGLFTSPSHPAVQERVRRVWSIWRATTTSTASTSTTFASPRLTSTTRAAPWNASPPGSSRAWRVPASSACSAPRSTIPTLWWKRCRNTGTCSGATASPPWCGKSTRR